jgi:hypothetical protein
MTVIIEWIISWQSDNVWWYVDVGWLLCVLVSYAVFGRGQLKKTPEKIKCGFIYAVWLNPISEAHFFLSKSHYVRMQSSCKSVVSLQHISIVTALYASCWFSDCCERKMNAAMNNFFFAKNEWAKNSQKWNILCTTGLRSHPCVRLHQDFGSPGPCTVLSYRNHLVGYNNRLIG